MRARLLAAGLALCALIAPIGAMGCHKQSDSSAPDLSVGSGVSSGLDLVQSLLGGSMKTEASRPGEDADLKAALITAGDLPPGFTSPMGDMRMTGDTAAGSVRAIYRMFSRSDSANPARASEVMAAVMSGLPSSSEKLDSNDAKKSADKSGLYQSTEALDTSGIGEGSSGLRMVSDLGLIEQITWVRDDVFYMLFLMQPQDWPNPPPDGVALARIMDDRASGKAPIPTAPSAAAAPTVLPGAADAGSILGGAAPKVDSDAPPADLAALLLTKDDLPPGFEPIMKDMHITADGPAGPDDAAASAFMKQGENGLGGGTMLLAYAYAFTPSNAPASCEAMQSYAKQTGAYKEVDALDATGLGDASCATRTISDSGVQDCYVWSRGNRYFMVIVQEIKTGTQSTDGLALAKIMDSRAQEATH